MRPAAGDGATTRNESGVDRNGQARDSNNPGAELPGTPAPEPDAQLASNIAAPAVSPPTRETRAGAQARTRTSQRPAPAAAPSRVATQTAPAAAGKAADTRAAQETARTKGAESPAEAATDPDDGGPGELAAVTSAIDSPVPERSAPAPDEFGPVPEPGPASPLTVPMSELEMKRFVEPRYPRGRSARTMGGWVELEFRVDKDGRTADVRVMNSEPPEVFEAAAKSAVAKWRFKPKLVDGEAVEVVSGVRLRFEPSS
jgi:TonB family protein